MKAPSVEAAELDPAVPRDAPAEPVGSAPWSRDSIQDAMGAVAGRLTGEVGVAALHLETGRRLAWNGHHRFLMASVYKLPIALVFLQAVDAGAVSLDDSITIQPNEFVGGANPMTAGAGGGPVTLTMRRILEYMVSESDNTASDAILRTTGGPKAVRARLGELGVADVDVSRYEAEIFADAQARRGEGGHDPADSRDTATPEVLVDLLDLVHRGEGLSLESRELLLDLMTKTPVGPDRIKGLLPPGTPVAHKTGTHGAVTNDVGIVTLPDGSHLAIAVLLHASDATLAERERTIAELARAAYDAFAPTSSGAEEVR